MRSADADLRYEGRLQQQTVFEEINARDAGPPTGDRPVFTQDWVSNSAQYWDRYLDHLKGRRGATGLEIGSFEGRSAIWFLDHILTDPSASLTSVDLFGERLDAYFDHNIRVSGLEGRVQKLAGPSQQVLRSLPVDQPYDFIYVDGCHLATCALTDIVLSWELLKRDGVLIVDDYQWLGPPLERPKMAVDAFLAIYEPHVEVLHKGFQVIVRKTDSSF